MAGIPIGGAAVLLLAAALLYLYRRPRTLKEMVAQTQHPPPSYITGNPGHMPMVSSAYGPPKSHTYKSTL